MIRLRGWMVMAAALVLVACGAARAGEAWVPVPLRTAAQKAAGFAGGEMGQMGFCLAISKKNPSRLALSLDTAGLYLSLDGGATWQIRRSGLRSNGANSVAFDPENANVLFAAGNKNIPGADPYYDSAADGIYRSTDLGLSWQRVHPAGFRRSAGQNEYFAFAAPSGGISRTVLAITHDQGLLKSLDGGNTWARVTSVPSGVWGHAILRHPANGCLWLAANEGLWRSTDSGATWVKTAGGLPAGAVRGLALHPTSTSTLYAALGTNGIWRTADSGGSWQKITNGLPASDWTRLARGAGAVLWADALSSVYMPYRTANEGASWSASSTGRDGYYPLKWFSEGMVAHPTDGNTAYFVPELRITRDGGQTWPVQGAGISGSRMSSRTGVACRPEDPNKIMLFHTDWGSSFTADGGDTWQWRPAPRQSFGAWTQPGGAYDSTPGSRKLVSAVGGWDKQVLCKSTDDGQTWQVIDSTPRNYTFFAWHPQNGSVVYVGHSGGSLRSENGASTWQAVAQPIRAMFKGNGDLVYSYSWPSGSTTRVLKSTDRGRNWTQVGADIPGQVKDLDVDPANANWVYAAGIGGVWVYDGSVWSGRGTASGLETDFFGGLDFASVAADPKTAGVVYAGQNVCWRGVARGVYRSTDHGQTWRNLNLNLGNDLTVWGISVTPQGTAWLGTDHGSFRLASGGTATPPQLTKQPASQTVTVGQTATFSVTATGTAPLAYQWQRNGANLAGATAASYTTPATTAAEGGGRYRVVVSNSAGSVTSAEATLTVNPPPNQAPVISSASPDSPATVVAGAMQTFSVSAYDPDDDTLTYTWKVDGSTTTVAGSALNYSPSGADAGSHNFEVMVSDDQGGSVKQTWSVTVILPVTPPAITAQPANKTVTAGQAASFSVTATGTAPLTYQWRKNGANISQATTASYTLPATTFADSGSKFSVVVSNSAGSVASAEATLTVLSGSSGTGLKGEYFDNADFTNLKLTRTDARVDFNWETGSPAAAVGAETFSVRWTGQVQPLYTETYTFHTVSDDGIRLWVDGRLVVDNWTLHARTENSGSIGLAAGQRYAIKMEFYENSAYAVARLLWSSPSTPKEIVPQGQLYSAAAPANLAPNPGFESDPAADYFTVGAANFVWATDQRHGGSHSLKIVSTQGSTVLTRWLSKTNAIPATAGAIYTATAWLKAANVANQAALTINFWNASLQHLGSFSANSLTGTKDWTPASVQATAPVGTAYVRVEFRLYGSGTLWIDDLSLAK